MTQDSIENVALIRTFEKNHICFLVSIDGGTKALKIYVGQKNKGRDGRPNTVDFMARNGLTLGSCHYLTGAAPTTKGETTNGKFSESFFFAMHSDHCEDIHTNPLHPSQVTLCEEKHGVCIFDFNLSFSSMDGSFQPKSSTFSVTMVVNDDQVPMKATDNVVWTENSLVHVATDGSNAGL